MRKIQSRIQEVVQDHCSISKTSQKELAKELGISEVQFSKILNGKSGISDFWIERIAEKLGVPLTALVAGEDEQSSVIMRTPEDVEIHRKLQDILDQAPQPIQEAITANIEGFHKVLPDLR